MTPEPSDDRPFYLTGMLAWVVPGAGHFYLGMYLRGIIIFLTIGGLFWTGVAIGGVRSTVDPQHNKPWFVGQMITGVNGLAALSLRRSVYGDAPGGVTGPALGRSALKTRDIGIVYSGVAGLLNLLVVFNAMVRSFSGPIKEEDAASEPRDDNRNV